MDLISPDTSSSAVYTYDDVVRTLKDSETAKSELLAWLVKGAVRDLPTTMCGRYMQDAESEFVVAK